MICRVGGGPPLQTIYRGREGPHPLLQIILKGRVRPPPALTNHFPNSVENSFKSRKLVKHIENTCIFNHRNILTYRTREKI